MPYFWAGLKAYDLVAGTQGLTMSRFISASEAKRQFPMLAASGPGGHSLKAWMWGGVCGEGAPDRPRATPSRIT